MILAFGGLGVGAVILGVGLLFAIGILTSKKPGGVEGSLAVTTTSQRGSVLPVVIGRERIGAKVMWIGKRKSFKGRGAGKGSSGGGGPKEYSEEGLHGLCVGECQEIRRIYVSNVDILEPAGYPNGLTPLNAPHGSTIEIDGHGTIQVFWGTGSQTVDPLLTNSERLNIASAFPYHVMVWWRRRLLGSGTNWPNIEYEVLCRPRVSGFSLGTSDMLGAAPEDGANPAHAIAQLITQPPPWGCGRDPARIDLDSLKLLGQVAQAENIPVTVVVGEGDSVQEKIAAILADVGVGTPIIRGKLTFRPVRPDLNPYVIHEAILDEGDPPERKHATDHKRAVGAITVSFRDVARKHKPNAFPIDDDGAADLNGVRRGQSVSLDTIRSETVAAAVGQRRQGEEAASGWAVKLRAHAGTRLIYPTDVIAPPEHLVPYPLRVLRAKPLKDRASTLLECIIDHYGVVAGAYDPFAGAPLIPPLAEPPEPDPFAGGTEIPPDHPMGYLLPPSGGGSPLAQPLLILRGRANESVVGADVWVALDEAGPYHFVSTVEAEQVTGTLVASLALQAPGTVVASLMIDVTCPEGDVATLDPGISDGPSGPDYLSGRHVAIFDPGGPNEEFALVERAALGGGPGLADLEEITRGAYGGGATAEHPAGTKVAIVDTSTAEVVVDPLFVAGNTVYVKVVPFSRSRTVDIASVTAFPYTF